jgi:hypothetical protein
MRGSVISNPKLQYVMKRIVLISTAAVCLLASSLSAQFNVEFWEFNDPVGTDLNDLFNTGTLGSSWNFNTPNDLTNGTQFVIGGDGGTTTRKLPDGLNERADDDNIYASPLSTGVYTLNVNFAGWDFSSASLGDTWKIGVNEADGSSTIAQIIFEVDSATSTRLRFATETDTGGKFRNFAYGLTQSSPVDMTIEFDFDNNTVRYLLDGSETHSFDDFSGTEIGQLIYVKSGDGTDDWVTAASSVTINSMGLASVPEPATFAFLAGIGALGLGFYRRKRLG